MKGYLFINLPDGTRKQVAMDKDKFFDMGIDIATLFNNMSVKESDTMDAMVEVDAEYIE